MNRTSKSRAGNGRTRKGWALGRYNRGFEGMNDGRGRVNSYTTSTIEDNTIQQHKLKEDHPVIVLKNPQTKNQIKWCESVSWPMH